MSVPTLDKCPGYNLYISGFIALRRPQALKNCHVTHIVSVLDWQFEKDAPLIRGYHHLHIPVDDVEDENLLEWFPRSNAFIHEGLNYWRKERNESPTPALGPSDVAQDATETSGVLIHCAMGKSRSATVLLAYILWASRQPKSESTADGNTETSPSLNVDDSEMVALAPKPLSVVEALILLRQGRPIAEPNEGFMDQLHLYVDMGCPTTQKQLDSHKLYRRWMNKRNVLESLRINRAPEMDDIIFEDESADDDEDADKDNTNHADSARHQQPIAPGITAPDGTSTEPKANSLNPLTGSATPNVELKCRKCRRLLARSAFIVPHVPPGHRDPSAPISAPSSDGQVQAPQCAHIFLHPLSWMKATLADGQLDGRLSCPNPKCGANVGKFAWQGMRCSCGGWVTPGFGVARGRVDEVVVRSGLSQRDEGGVAGGRKGAPVGEGPGLRLPPGMRKGNL